MAMLIVNSYMTLTYLVGQSIQNHAGLTPPNPNTFFVKVSQKWPHKMKTQFSQPNEICLFEKAHTYLVEMFQKNY